MSLVAGHLKKSPAPEDLIAERPGVDHTFQTEHDDHDEQDHKHGFEWLDIACMVLVVLAAAAVWIDLWEFVGCVQLRRAFIAGL